MTFKEFYILKEGKGVPFTSDKREAIINAYKSGMSNLDIMNTFNLPKPTLYTILRNAKIPAHTKNKTIPEEMKQQILNDIKAGMKDVDIMKKYDVSDTYINNIKKKYSLPIRKLIFITPEQTESIKTLGMEMDPNNEHYLNSYQAISDKIGIDLNAVSKVLRKVKLPNGKTLAEDRLEKGIVSALGRVYIRNQAKAAKLKGTRQKAFGPLGPNDPSYRFTMGRAQDINDKDIK